MKWKKTAIITIDLLVGIYLVLAMTAFNKPDETKDVCTYVHIEIERDLTDGFLDEKAIRLMLRHSGLTMDSLLMKDINTRKVEEVLQGHELIDHVDCYKAINGVVCIKVHQRVPVIRVMADNHEDYYVDSQGGIIDRKTYIGNQIVATGAITKKYASEVLAPVADIIRANDLWKNQIVQLNVLDDGSLELIPRVGDHIAYLGQPVDIEKKLERLRKFYRYGLNEAGWNRYSRISVEYGNQIICKKRKTTKRTEIW